MRQVFLVAVVVVVALAAQACTRTVTVRGKIGVGSLDSGIETPVSGCCGFLTDSDVAASIFSVCKFQDECEITGKIDSNDFFMSVSSMRKIDTNVEPSAVEIKEAACKSFGFNEWSCNNIYSESSVEIDSMHKEGFGNDSSWVIKIKLRYKTISSHVSVLYDCKDIRLVHGHGGWYLQQ